MYCMIIIISIVLFNDNVFVIIFLFPREYFILSMVLYKYLPRKPLSPPVAVAVGGWPPPQDQEDERAGGRGRGGRPASGRLAAGSLEDVAAERRRTRARLLRFTVRRRADQRGWRPRGGGRRRTRARLPGLPGGVIEDANARPTHTCAGARHVGRRRPR